MDVVQPPKLDTITAFNNPIDAKNTAFTVVILFIMYPPKYGRLPSVRPGPVTNTPIYVQQKEVSSIIARYLFLYVLILSLIICKYMHDKNKKPDKQCEFSCLAFLVFLPIVLRQLYVIPFIFVCQPLRNILPRLLRKLTY